MVFAALNWFGRTGLVGEVKSFLGKTPNDYHGPPVPPIGGKVRESVVRPPGLEPGTCGLRARCSAN